MSSNFDKNTQQQKLQSGSTTTSSAITPQQHQQQPQQPHLHQHQFQHYYYQSPYHQYHHHRIHQHHQQHQQHHHRSVFSSQQQQPQPVAASSSSSTNNDGNDASLRADSLQQQQQQQLTPQQLVLLANALTTAQQQQRQTQQMLTAALLGVSGNNGLATGNAIADAHMHASAYTREAARGSGAPAAQPTAAAIAVSSQSQGGPAAVAVSEGSAMLLINGTQLLQCRLPTPAEPVCSVDALASSHLRIMEDYGRTELSCLFYPSTEVGKLEWRPFVGDLIVDDGAKVIRLGQLPGAELETVTRYVDAYPTTLRLRVTYDDSGRYEHPDEGRLLDELLLLLRDPFVVPPGGSTSHSNVYNRLKDLDCYGKVLLKFYKGKLSSFYERHADSVLMGRRTQHDMKRRGQSIRVHQHFVMLTDNRSTADEADRRFDEQRVDDERTVVAKLCEMLRTRDYEYGELLEKISAMPEFVDTLTPSATLVTRLLQSRDDVFWVRKDPEHTTRVGLVRH